MIMCAGLSCPIDLTNSTGLHLWGSGWPVLDFGAEFLALTAAQMSHFESLTRAYPCQI